MLRSKLTMLMAVIGFVFLQIACGRSGNINTANANMATPQATPDTAAITEEISKIENDWPRIIKERDGATVRKIEADDIVIVYPLGDIGGKDLDSKDIESGGVTFDAWDISELNVKILDSDAAVASLRITVKNGKYKMPDGRRQDISGQYRSIDTYVRRNGQWQAIAMATTPIKSPAAQVSPSPKASPAISSTPATRSSPITKPSPVMRSSPVPKPAPTRRPSPVPVQTPA